MKTSILFQTLKAFTDEELDQLDQFIRSPYFNPGTHHNQNITLFVLLKKAILQNRFLEIDKTWLAEQLSGKEAKGKSSGYLENRMSELMTIIRKFITWNEVQESWGKVFEELACYRFYKKRRIVKIQEQTIRKARKVLGKGMVGTEEYPLVQYWVEKSVFEMEHTKSRQQSELNIPNTIDALSVFYATKLMELALADAQQIRVVPGYESQRKMMLRDMRLLFQRNAFWENAALMMLEQALILMEDNTDNPIAHLQQYLEKMKEQEQYIAISIMKKLAAYARNYCTWKINMGYRGFRVLRFNLYKNHLEKGYLYENGKLIPSSFVNMINVGIWASDLDWVSKLLKNYGGKVNGADNQKIVTYGYALLEKNKGQLSEARTYLNELFQSEKFKDMRLEQLVRILEIKILYEDNDELIFSRAHNFLMFIRRNDRIFNEEMQALHLKFKKITDKLFKLKTAAESSILPIEKLSVRLDKIEQELTTPNAPVGERLWLLEKLNEIRKEKF